MILVDDHCHLMHAAYKDKIDEVLDRARKAGVKAIICSGINPPTNKEALELAEKYPDIIRASLAPDIRCSQSCYEGGRGIHGCRGKFGSGA